MAEDGPAFAVQALKDGTCDVWIQDPASGERSNVRTLGPGSCCGELSLVTGKPRSASIMATSAEVTLLMVNRRVFNATIGDAIVKKRSDLQPFLSQISIFADMKDDYEMTGLIDACKRSFFEPGETIHENGKPSDGRFYLVRDGTVESAGLQPVKYAEAYAI